MLVEQVIVFEFQFSVFLLCGLILVAVEHIQINLVVYLLILAIHIVVDLISFNEVFVVALDDGRILVLLVPTCFGASVSALLLMLVELVQQTFGGAL